MLSSEDSPPPTGDIYRGRFEGCFRDHYAQLLAFTLRRIAARELAEARHWSVLLQMVHEKGFRGDELPARGNGWPSYIVEAAREIAAGHLRRRPAVKTTYLHGAVVGIETPRNAAPASVLGCRLGG